MVQRLTLEQIKDFWTSQALEHGQSPAASWSDQPVIDLEVRALAERLADGDRVLDVGCANGYTTLELARRRRVRIRGLDYIPEMIEQARMKAQAHASRLLGTVEFDVGDATNLVEPSDTYDKVLSVRVIINLGRWEDQLRGLRECARVVRPGGLLLLSEATQQGWQRLNHFRREWGLPDIPMPGFNNYLDRDQVVAGLAPALELVEVAHFASTYYVGSRVLKPLFIEALGLAANVADPSMEWNRWFAQLPAWGDYGTQQLMVFRKI